MNKTQKVVGWFFCSIIALVLLAGEQIVMGLAVIGFWSFVMAGSNRAGGKGTKMRPQTRVALKWTPGMIGAMEEAGRSIRSLPLSQQTPEIVKLARDMVETWGPSWVDDWLRLQDLPTADVVAVIAQWDDFPVISEGDSERLFEAAIILSMLGRID